MYHTFSKQGSAKLSSKAVAAFLLSGVLCSLIVVITVQNRQNIEKVTMEQLIMEKTNAVTEVISKLLYKTYTLSAFVSQDRREIENFEQIAATIVDNPAILNVLVAPDGIVSQVYPLKDNEQVIGLNMLGEGEGNLEAIKAKETGELVFGGPFNLIQGGQALVGRLPVYLEDDNGEEYFWGLVSVTLSYPEVLEGANLSALKYQGLSYEIWRISPDHNIRQIIAGSGSTSTSPSRYIEKHIPLMNADWYFRIAPLRKWYEYAETWIMILASLAFSFLISFITQSNVTLRSMKTDLESMVQTDALTGILNRKGLFHELNRLIRLERKFFIYYMDLNKFKQINDTYGHNIGDQVLVEFVSRIDRHIDGSHIFARVGGDEFVLVHVDERLSEEKMDGFWKELEQEFAQDMTVKHGDPIQISFSKGMAAYPRDGNSIDELLGIADHKMYYNKQKIK